MPLPLGTSFSSFFLFDVGHNPVPMRCTLYPYLPNSDTDCPWQNKSLLKSCFPPWEKAWEPRPSPSLRKLLFPPKWQRFPCSIFYEADYSSWSSPLLPISKGKKADETNIFSLPLSYPLKHPPKCIYPFPHKRETGKNKLASPDRSRALSSRWQPWSWRFLYLFLHNKSRFPPAALPQYKPPNV